MPKVCIDCGHNDRGTDVGVQGNGLKEHELTLDIGLRLKKILQANGFEVMMTREGDFVNGPHSTIQESLKTRCDIANQFGTELFVSIHINAGGGTGIEVYSLPGGRAIVAAQRVLERLTFACGWANRGVKTNQQFYVLVHTDMPAILTENGFIDSSDAKKLVLTEFRQTIAEAHAKGICDYFGVGYRQINQSDLQAEPNYLSSIKYRVILDGQQIMVISSLDEAIAKVKKYVDNDLAYLGVVQRINDTINLFTYSKSYNQQQTPTAQEMFSSPESSPTPLPLSLPAFKASMTPVISQSIQTQQSPQSPQSENTPPVPITPAKLGKKTPIMGLEIVTVEQCYQFLRKNNPYAPNVIPIYEKYGVMLGIRWGYAVAQMIEETGYLKFGGEVKPEQNNFAGIGATARGVKGASFATPEEGVLAHLEHLFAYASSEPLPPSLPKVDPRFNLVTRGCCPYWEDLDGRWAVPGIGYGQDIVRIYQQISVEVVTKQPSSSDTGTQQPLPQPSSEKPWYDSKTVWVNLLMIGGIISQLVTGHEVLTPEVQVLGIGFINLILRAITENKLTWK